MTEWISYKDLYNRYSEGGIIHLFRKGLQPYDENYEDVYCLYEHHEYSHVYNNYSPQDPYRSQRLHEIVDNDVMPI